MENVAGKLKDAIGGLTEILIGAIGRSCSSRSPTGRP